MTCRNAEGEREGEGEGVRGRGRERGYSLIRSIKVGIREEEGRGRRDQEMKKEQSKEEGGSKGRRG